MDKKDPKYESLKSKLLKLSMLADSGDTHEARNARYAIERLCSQYGISIEIAEHYNIGCAHCSIILW